MAAAARVEVLYVDGCPHHEPLLSRLGDLAAELGIDAAVELTRVESPEDAERERFLGSPTLRINGQDVDPSATGRTDYALKCRLYAGPDGLSGNVPEPFIRAALGVAPA